MAHLNQYIAVGWSDGEPEFSVSGLVQDLSLESMNELRAMCVVAIGTMEDMWRREQQRKFDRTAQETSNWQPTI